MMNSGLIGPDGEIVNKIEREEGNLTVLAGLLSNR